MTRILTIALALVGLAALSQPAAANSCLPQHHVYLHSAHYEHVSRVHRAHYVVVERPTYRTVYERVYEPVPVAPYDGPYWTSGPYEGEWTYDDGPVWNVGYHGTW